MADIEKLRRNLENRYFETSYFETAEEAAEYLNGKIDGAVVGFGGSKTLTDMGLYDMLKEHNTVLWHAKGDSKADVAKAKVYLMSANGVSENGEIVNIDGTGNRVAEMISGPDRLYIVIGKNKITADLESAMNRAHCEAGPKNAQRLKFNTPCAAKGDKCYNCSSTDRICNVMVVLWRAAKLIPEGTEVVIINENLGL